MIRNRFVPALVAKAMPFRRPLNRNVLMWVSLEYTKSFKNTILIPLPITLYQDTSTEAKDSAKTDAQDENEDKKTLGLTNTRSTLEERRKSLLDHHWAIPSKDRLVLNEFDCVLLIIILVFNIWFEIENTIVNNLCSTFFCVFTFIFQTATLSMFIPPKHPFLQFVFCFCFEHVNLYTHTHPYTCYFTLPNYFEPNTSNT